MEENMVIDANTIETLFRTYYDGLCRYAFTILKGQDEAEDVVQKLFIKLWEKRNELEIAKDVKSYLFRSTYNASLNELKRLKKKNMHDTIDSNMNLQGNEDASSTVLSAELESKIEAAINTLPEKCGEVFKMSRMKELSYKEISEQLNVSIKTVENHMGKALKLMRVALSEYLPELVLTILLMQGW